MKTGKQTRGRHCPLGIVLAGMVALVASCASPKHNNNEMKTERLTYFSYDHHNSMSQDGERYNVKLQEDGRVHVVIDEGRPSEKEFYLDDSTILDELLAIVKEYKMDKYKEDYKPWMDITDGDNWSLYYKYDTKRSVSSGGYMAWPDNYGEMRKALSGYFQKWREYEKGVLLIDYFHFTCKNKAGRDEEYTLERGATEATMTLRDAEKGIDKTLKMDNGIMMELQQTANAANLKSTLYDYHTDDENATRCTYYVRYSTGDTLSGYTCFTQYIGHKENAILEFFRPWMGE